MTFFRKGQWVKGKLPSNVADMIHFAHRVGEYYVGIYHPASRSGTSVNGEQQEPEPESVTLVKADGHGAPMLPPDGAPVDAKLSPSLFEDLQPVLSMGELPPGRDIAPGFVLTS